MKNAVFVHDKALVELGARLGAGTRVWAFAHILPGAVIGEDCNICDHVFIENAVTIGDRVTIKSAYSCGTESPLKKTLLSDLMLPSRTINFHAVSTT